MTFRISDAPISSSAKWGVAAAVTLGAVVLATKVYTVFNRFIQTSVTKPETDQNVIAVKLNDADKKLLEATNRYLVFINRISKGEVFPQREVAVSLLASDCKKILNGNVYTTTRDDFISDLLEVNRTKGCWTVKPVAIISSPKNECVTLRLMIDMEKLGPFTAIIILRFNASYLISEINEVFNRVDGSYHFDGDNQ